MEEKPRVVQSGWTMLVVVIAMWPAIIAAHLVAISGLEAQPRSAAAAVFLAYIYRDAVFQWVRRRHEPEAAENKQDRLGL